MIRIAFDAPLKSLLRPAGRLGPLRGDVVGVRHSSLPWSFPRCARGHHVAVVRLAAAAGLVGVRFVPLAPIRLNLHMQPLLQTTCRGPDGRSVTRGQAGLTSRGLPPISKSWLVSLLLRAEQMQIRSCLRRTPSSRHDSRPCPGDRSRMRPKPSRCVAACRPAPI